MEFLQRAGIKMSFSQNVTYITMKIALNRTRGTYFHPNKPDV